MSRENLLHTIHSIRRIYIAPILELAPLQLADFPSLSTVTSLPTKLADFPSQFLLTSPSPKLVDILKDWRRRKCCPASRALSDPGMYSACHAERLLFNLAPERCPDVEKFFKRLFTRNDFGVKDGRRVQVVREGVQSQRWVFICECLGVLAGLARDERDRTRLPYHLHRDAGCTGRDN